MMRRITKNGIVDSDEYLLDEEGNKTNNKPPEKLDLRELNIVNTYFWFNDLRGRLKQELHLPSQYHGFPRMYVKEDIEKEEDNKLISHLRVYYGRKLLAEIAKPMPEYIVSFAGYNNDEDLRFQIRTTVNFLINEGGWKLYKIEDQGRFRKIKRTPHKPKRSTVKKSLVKKKIVCKCKRTTKKKR